MLLAVDDHKYRIEVGYGLEGILPDGKVGDIGREMVPDLRASDYDGAVTLAVGQVAQVIAADAKVTLTDAARSAGSAAARHQQLDRRQAHSDHLCSFCSSAASRCSGCLLVCGPVFGGWGRGGCVDGRWIGGGGFGGGGSVAAGGGGGFGGFGGGGFGGGGAGGSW